MLKVAAQALAAAKRSEDILARLGGEEFAVILASQQSLEGALDAADRMREAVERMQLVTRGASVAITVSGGVALYPDEGGDWDRLYAIADRRLYAAKNGGRNRIVANG